MRYLGTKRFIYLKLAKKVLSETMPILEKDEDIEEGKYYYCSPSNGRLGIYTPIMMNKGSHTVLLKCWHDDSEVWTKMCNVICKVGDDEGDAILKITLLQEKGVL